MSEFEWLELQKEYWIYIQSMTVEPKSVKLRLKERRERKVKNEKTTKTATSTSRKRI